MPPKYSCLLRHSVTQRNEMNLFYNPQTSSTPSPEPTKGLSGLKLCPCPITLSIYKQLNHITSSGAETNLKVGGTCHAPPLILTLQIQLLVLVSAFVMASTVWSVSCFLFFYSLCPLPRAQPFVKVWGGGGTCPPRATWSRRHWLQKLTYADRSRCQRKWLMVVRFMHLLLVSQHNEHDPQVQQALKHTLMPTVQIQYTVTGVDFCPMQRPGPVHHFLNPRGLPSCRTPPSFAKLNKFGWLVVISLAMPANDLWLY